MYAFQKTHQHTYTRVCFLYCTLVLIIFFRLHCIFVIRNNCGGLFGHSGGQTAPKREARLSRRNWNWQKPTLSLARHKLIWQIQLFTLRYNKQRHSLSAFLNTDKTKTSITGCTGFIFKDVKIKSSLCFEHSHFRLRNRGGE